MKYLPALFLLSTLLLAACGHRDAVVGRFNDQPLMRSGVEAELVREGVPSGRANFSARMTAVSNMILRRLFLLDARQKGYYERQDIRDLFERQKMEFVRRMVMDKVTGSPSVRLAAGDLRRYTSIISCRLIYFNAPVCLDAAYRKRKYEEAKNCERLVTAANFSELANLYTDLPSNRKGGYIGPATVSNSPAAVRAVAASLPAGAISDVVPLDRGFCIVKVEKTDRPGQGTVRPGVSWIFLSAEPTNRSAVLETILGIRRELQKDPSRFKELANRWSEDPANLNAGRLRPFVYEQMNPVVSDAAWRTRRGVPSRLLSDRSGFFIVLPDSVQVRSRQELGQFRKNRELYKSVKQRILQRKVNAIRELRYTAFLSRLLAKARVIRDYSCFTNEPAATNAGATVVAKILYNNEVLTYGDYLEVFARDAGRFGGTPSYIDRVNIFETRLLVPQLLFADGLRRGYLQSRVFRKEFGDFCDNTVFARYFQDAVDAWSVSDSQVRAFYDAHRQRFGNTPFEKAAEMARRHAVEEQKPLIARNRMIELLQIYRLEIQPLKLMTRKEKRLFRIRTAALAAEKKAEYRAAADGYASGLRSDHTDVDSILGLYRNALRLAEGRDRDLFARQAVSAADRSLTRLAARFEDPSNWSLALSLFSRSSSSSTARFLAGLLQYPDRRLVAGVIPVLAEIRATNASAALLELVKRERRGIVVASNMALIVPACAALGRLGLADAKTYMVSWLGSEHDYRFQLAVIPGLAEFRDRTLAPLLRQYLVSPSPDVRKAASAGLAVCTNR